MNKFLQSLFTKRPEILGLLMSITIISVIFAVMGMIGLDFKHAFMATLTIVIVSGYLGMQYTITSNTTNDNKNNIEKG